MLDLATLSNRHVDLAARDAETVFGWRFEPRIVKMAPAGSGAED